MPVVRGGGFSSGGPSGELRELAQVEPIPWLGLSGEDLFQLPHALYRTERNALVLDLLSNQGTGSMDGDRGMGRETKSYLVMSQQ